MLWAMFAGPHYAGYGYGTAVGGTGLIVALVIIAAIELNGLKGKQGPLTTVRGVIVSSLVLTAVLALALNALIHKAVKKPAFRAPVFFMQ